MKLNRELLRQLEQKLDPYNPEEGEVPIEILGYGEISLVFKIINDPAGDIAYKRLPIFSSVEEVESHIEAYKKYNELLKDININIPNYDATWVYADEKQKNITLYCAQEVVPSYNVCHVLLHKLPDKEIYSLVNEILEEIIKIWKFNSSNNDIKLGFDGQISNFAKYNGELYYLDTSTPMYRIDGEDAMKGTLFLKSAPPGIRFILKIFFLEEVLDRYYDLRSVLIDLLANFYKEQREDLIPDLLILVNDFLQQQSENINKIEELTIKEIEAYYKEDKFIWSLFQKVRKIHRFILTKIFRRKYPFYLPDEIQR